MAFLMPPHSASANLQRMLGVAGAVIEAGRNWSSRNIIYVNADDQAALKKALSAKPRPDVVICHNDQTAAELPRSVNVAGFDGLDNGAKRRFPTVRQPVRQIAETAINTLLERIKRPEQPPRQILLEPRGNPEP